ncbi:Rieske 2Fe-2S domain-containing protein [Micrococcales bacterium 31B]|nr:Rieske 2Fe-2S domain-containing protein [Micrococcales bacterium 31B]
MSNHDNNSPTGGTVAESHEVTRTAVNAPQRFANPGLPPHKHRMADESEAAANKAERQVAFLFLLSILGTIWFIYSYFAFNPEGTMESIFHNTLFIGLGLFAMVFFIGAAAVHWAKTLMPDEEVTDERHPMRGTDEDREIAVKNLTDGIREASLGRRPLIKWSMIGALGLLPIAAVFPLGTLGPFPGNALFHTLWANPEHRYLVRDGIRTGAGGSGTRIKAADVTMGSVFHVMPEGINEVPNHIEEKAKAAVLLIRLNPNDLIETAERESWSYDGIVAYSKICTHVGCPVALYEQQTHHLLCPCHQSTFDVTHEARVIFGPAHRPLPQLPIEVDEEGYIRAQMDFQEPVGPSFWEIQGSPMPLGSDSEEGH